MQGMGSEASKKLKIFLSMFIKDRAREPVQQEVPSAVLLLRTGVTSSRHVRKSLVPSFGTILCLGVNTLKLILDLLKRFFQDLNKCGLNEKILIGV